MSELDDKRDFDAHMIARDLHDYKNKVAPIPWVDPLWIEKMEKQFAEEARENGWEIEP